MFRKVIVEGGPRSTAAPGPARAGALAATD